MRERGHCETGHFVGALSRACRIGGGTGTRSLCDVGATMSRLLQVIKLAEKPIRGAAFVPVYQYPPDGYTRGLRGRFCVFLGRERGGFYRNKMNFFGGKVGHGEDPMHALIREVAEELCVKVTPEILDSCLVDTRLLPRRTWLGSEHFTLLVFVHITGIRRRTWLDIQKERQRQHAPYCQREMSEVAHLPLDDILTRHDVSSYVQENVSHIENAMRLLTFDRSITFQSLQTILRPDQVSLYG